MTSQTKTKAKIPFLGLFITRILFTSFFLLAGIYDIFYVVLHASGYLWVLLYSVPIVLLNGFALTYFVLTRSKENDQRPDKIVFYVAVTNLILWMLCLLALGQTDGETGLSALGVSWPVAIDFGCVILLSILSQAYHKKGKKAAFFFYYASLILCFFALLGFSILIAYQDFFLCGGILYGIGSFLFLVSGSLR